MLTVASLDRKDDVKLSAALHRLVEEDPSLELYRSEKIATAVLFHPTAHVVSQGVRDELSHFPELEFLPVDVAGYGQFYAMHVLTSCDLPAGSVADTGPGTDIALIRAFPKSFEAPAPFFRIRHPGTLRP